MATAQKGKKQTVVQKEAIHAGAKWWLYESYVSYLPKRKIHRRSIIATVLVLIAIIAAQLVYPSDRGLPLASANGVKLGYKTHDEMAKVITDQFSASKLKLTVGNDKSVTVSLSQSGAEPNTEDMVTQVSHYPLWQRLLPGSILWQPVQVAVADVYYDKAPLEAFAKTESKALTFPPQNARLAIKDGKLTANAEVAGSTVDSAALERAISSTPMKLGETTVLNVPSKRTPPAQTLKDLSKVRAQAEAAINHAVTITAGAQQFTPSTAEIASWLLLGNDSAGKVTLSVDKAKVKQYLAKINDKVGTPAGQTDIEVVDGREASRTTGVAGKAIDSDTLTNQLASQLLESSKAIRLTAQFVDVQPSVIYNHKYTATQAGLQAYVNDMASSRDMHIVVQQLSGQKWYAAAREHESIPSASTFKLFVALVLFDKINKGEIHWDDPMLDTTVAGCFDRMTVPSTNPCAEAWIAQFGRQYIDNFIYARGFSTGTTFEATDAVHTTAADLTKFMIGLNNGTLVSGANRDRLLNNLSRQPYKYGIPTGSSVPANQIYDKVGFLWDYVHDTAIVPHPRGTYILTIMSKGQGYSGVAAVARQIERIMYP